MAELRFKKQGTQNGVDDCDCDSDVIVVLYYPQSIYVLELHSQSHIGIAYYRFSLIKLSIKFKLVMSFKSSPESNK